MRREFTFNTGVRQDYHPKDGGPPISLFGPYQRWRPAQGGGSVKVILFYADVPEGATFLFGANSADLPEGKADDVIVAPILEGGLLSSYGYFRLAAGAREGSLATPETDHVRRPGPVP